MKYNLYVGFICLKMKEIVICIYAVAIMILATFNLNVAFRSNFSGTLTLANIVTLETSTLKSKTLGFNKFQFLSNQYDIPSGKYIWEAQLDMAIEHNYMLEDSKLELKRYQYIRHVKNIDDLEDIKSCLLDNNALLPIPSYKDSTKNKLRLCLVLK